MPFDPELIEARRLFFRYYQPFSLPIPEAESKILDTAARQNLNFDDQPVAVYTWGEGPTVLLVHGGLGYGAQFVPFIEPLRAAGYRVVILDVPGHGRSPHRFTSGDISAHVVHAVADQVAPVRTVVTHSMGCMWALHAKRHGMPGDSMVCISPFADAYVVFRTFVAMQRAPAGVVSRLERLLEAFDGPDIFGRFSPERIVRELGAVPGLVLHGDQDTFVSPEEGRKVAAAWSGCRFELSAGTNHLSILTDRLTIDRVIEFIRAQNP